MSMYVISVIVTVLLYSTLAYISYVSVFIAVKGLKFNLISPLLKSLVFIIFCYTSIISDVMLFLLAKSPYIVIKNSFLLVLIVFSLISVRLWKGEIYLWV